MRLYAAALAALCVSACATAPVPYARPLNADQIAALGPTKVVVADNNNGVGKSWVEFDSASAGAQQGLLGALVSIGLDAMMNYGPSRRARKSADEVAAVMPVETLNQSLATHVSGQVPTGAHPSGVTISELARVPLVDPKVPIDDAVVLTTAYVLSEDASALRVTVSATYESTATPYETPYVFEGTPPKAELTGPTYRTASCMNPGSGRPPRSRPSSFNALSRRSRTARATNPGPCPPRAPPASRP